MASTDVSSNTSTQTPHSGCSVAFGRGVTTAEAGSARRLQLAVHDNDAAREDLIGRGVEVS